MRWFESDVAKRVEVNALHLNLCSFGGEFSPAASVQLG
jgi:hypothetical protein